MLNDRTRMDTVRIGASQRLQVLPRSAHHHTPLGAVANGQQAVMMIKLTNETDGELLEGSGRARPNRRSHRQEVPAIEGLAVAVLPKELADRLGLVLRLQVLDGLSTETPKVKQKTIKAGTQQVPPLGKVTVQRAATVLNTRRIAPDAERHLAVLATYPQQIEQSDQVRVRAVVEHDKSRIDRQAMLGRTRALFASRSRHSAQTLAIHPAGMGVAADPRLRFEQR